MDLGVAGLILIDKPPGLTSHDVVNVVRRGTGVRRVGHTGTLDPLATGLLILCLGVASRLSEYLIDKDKRYLARVRFGQSTNTYDAEGEITSSSDALPDRQHVEAALAKFRGPIQQRPPAFSAVKQGGRKAYELARTGQVVQLEPRPVEIYALTLAEWQPPECVLDVSCSSGTYIRALAHDLGQALGCGAHLTGLRRTTSGRFSVDGAVTLSDLQAAFAAGREAWRRYLRPVDEAVADWPEARLTVEQARLIQHGQPIPLDDPAQAAAWARAHDPGGDLIAILKADAQAGVWRPHKVLVAAAARPQA
jgi:tRNA pseudouridine55 synthase